MAKYLVETDGGNYEVETEDSPIQPALDIAGTVIGVGSQAIQGVSNINKSLGVLSPAQPQALDLVSKAVGKVGQGYNWLKNKYLDSPFNVVREPMNRVLSDKPMLEGNIPIKQFKDGKLKETGNVPISESPQSIFRHLQSLGIDTVLGMGVGKAGGAIAARNEPANMLTRAAKKHDRARGLVAEVLQPKSGEMDDVIDAALPEISKVKDYGQLKQKMGQAKEGLMHQRDYKLATSTKKVGEEYLEPLLDLYKQMNKDPQLASKSEPLAKAIHAEYEYLFSKPGRKISLMEAEQRKENLQTLTKPLLESGGADISDPAMKQAWDKIRLGFKQSIANKEPEVAALNKPYGGLREAEELAGIQKDLALKEGPHNLIKDLLAHVIRPGKASTSAALAREAFRRESGIAGKTAKAEKLYNRAKTLRELAGEKIRRNNP